MSNEAALLAAIRAEPNDDLPRLAYADWLEEQPGADQNARAEYIRLGLEMAKCSSPCDSLERQRLEGRIQVLFNEHAREWFPDFEEYPSLFDRARVSRTYTRGFLSGLEGATETLLQMGPDLLRMAPITSIEFHGLKARLLARLVAAPWLSALNELSLVGEWDETDWVPLCNSEHLATLRKLKLTHGVVKQYAADKFARATCWPGLERLELDTVSFPDRSAARMFAGSGFAGLRELILKGKQLYLSDVEGMVTAPALANVKRFALKEDSFNFDPHSVGHALTHASFWPGLQDLDLSQAWLKDQGLTELLQGNPPQLRSLGLFWNGLTAAGVCALAASPVLESLEDLSLSHNAVGNEGVLALTRNPAIGRLRVLDLSEGGLDDDGVCALARCPYLKNLRLLRIKNNPFGERGAREIVDSPCLRQLNRLRVGSPSKGVFDILRRRFGGAVSW